MSNENKNESSSHEHEGVDEEFDSIIGALVLSDPAFENAINTVRPSVADQRKKFSIIRAEHYNQWQEAGILGTVADRMIVHSDGDKFLGGARVSFQRHKERDRQGVDTEIWQLVVDNSTTTVSEDGLRKHVKSNIGFVPFARIHDGGMPTASPGFTQEQVSLVGAQVAQLESLRQDQMGLPNMGWDLNTFHDPSTALKMMPSKPKE